MKVLDLVADPDSTDEVIILLDPPAGYKPVENLVKVDSRAQVLWRAELPGHDGADCYVSVEVHGPGMVAASSWSGYRVLLSTHDGRLLRKDFTK